MLCSIEMAFSMAHGVGSLTFDEQHELRRRHALSYQPTNGGSAVLGHLYTGVKGLGVGVVGGLFAIAKNTYDGTRKEGVSVRIITLKLHSNGDYCTIRVNEASFKLQLSDTNNFSKQH